MQHWRSSSARQQSAGVRGPARHRGEHGRADRDGVVGHVLCHRRCRSPARTPRAVRAASAAGKFTPAFMRRLALAAVGFQLLTAPLATASPCRPRPALPPPRPQHPPGGLRLRSRRGHSRSHLRMRRPPAPAARRSGRRHDPRPGRREPAVEDAQPGGRARPARGAPPAAGDPAQGTAVTVRAGDSLWSLTAARLGPFATDVDIALQWPRLYQANGKSSAPTRTCCSPGQVLRLPPGP